MIKANELRIGNFATRHFEKGEGDFTTCTARDIFDCKRSEVEPDFKFHYEGIELTPEWLDRFGLTKHNQFYAKSWGKNGVEIVTYSEIYKSFMYQLSDHKDIVITSVHHLQNLFFALTGRELELKK